LAWQSRNQEGKPDIPVWWFRAVEQTGMSALPSLALPGKILLKKQGGEEINYSSSGLAFWSTPIAWRFDWRPHNQPEPI